MIILAQMRKVYVTTAQIHLSGGLAQWLGRRSLAGGLCMSCARSIIIIIIIITTTIFIVLSFTVPAMCESSLWFIWAKVGQRQVAANS